MATNLDYRQKLADKYWSVENFFNSADFQKFWASEQQRLKNALGTLDTSKTATQTDVMWANPITTTPTTTTATQTVANTPKVTTDTFTWTPSTTTGTVNAWATATTTSPKTVWNIWKEFWQTVETATKTPAVTTDVKSLWNDISNQGKMLDTKIAANQNKYAQLWDIYKNTIATESTAIDDLKNTYNETYWNQIARIQNLESLINTKFDEMIASQNKIKDNYLTVAKASDQAAAAAAENRLMWETWRGSAARVASYLADLNKQSDLNASKLEADSLKNINDLTSSYLKLKSDIASNLNLTDQQKSTYSQNLTDRINNLESLKNQLGTAVVEWTAKPIEEEIAKQESVQTSTVLQQKAQELNSTWQNKNPAARRNAIQAFIQQYWASYNIPSSLVDQAATAGTMTEAMRILYDNVKNQVEAAKKAAWASDKFSQMLQNLSKWWTWTWAWAWTSTANIKF